MDGTVKEQRLRTKNVNAKKVNTAKTQADRSWLGPHYRLFIGRQFSWFLISMRTYVSAHTKAIVVGRQIDRKIVGIPIQQESCSAKISIFNL
jgi:hypothetical protein